MCHRWAHQGYLLSLTEFFFPFPFFLSQLSVWLSYCTHSWPSSSTVTVHIKYFLIRVWNEANDVLDVPASLLQLTGSSSLGLAWKVETPTIRRRKKNVFFFPCIKCAANRRPKIDYKKLHKIIPLFAGALKQFFSHFYPQQQLIQWSDQWQHLSPRKQQYRFLWTPLMVCRGDIQKQKNKALDALSL